MLGSIYLKNIFSLNWHNQSKTQLGLSKKFRNMFRVKSVCCLLLKIDTFIIINQIQRECRFFPCKGGTFQTKYIVEKVCVGCRSSFLINILFYSKKGIYHFMVVFGSLSTRIRSGMFFKLFDRL